MKNNIEVIVKELAQEAFHLYPDCYNDKEDLKELAESYWDNRSEYEVERDYSSNVVLGDYIKWVLEEFNELLII